MSFETINESDIDGLTLPDSFPVQTAKAHYVDNIALSENLAQWIYRRREAAAAGKPVPDLPNNIGGDILKIAVNYAKKHNFNGYSFKEEMIGDAVENVLRYIGNYNPDAVTRSGKPNAFGYVSRTVHHAFTRRIQSEERQAYYKVKSFELSGGSDMFEGEDHETLAEMGVEDPHSIQSDFMSRIYDYERKQKDRANKDIDPEDDPTVDHKPSLLDFCG